MRHAPLWVHMSGERERDLSQHCDRGLLPTPHHQGRCPSSVDGHSHANQKRTLLANGTNRVGFEVESESARESGRNPRIGAHSDSNRVGNIFTIYRIARTSFTNRIGSRTHVGLLARPHRLNPLRWRATRHHTSQHFLGATRQHAFDASDANRQARRRLEPPRPPPRHPFVPPGRG